MEPLPSLLCLLAIVAAANAAKLKPVKNYFDVCRRSDPNYNSCFRSMLRSVNKYGVKGIPAMRVSPFEPLVIPRIEMGDGSGNFKLHQILTNLVIQGMSNYDVPSASLDSKKWEMNYTLFHPKLDFEGDYVIDGQLLLIPIKGEGRVTFNFTDVTTMSMVKLEEFKKGGNSYLRVKDYKLSIVPKHAQSYFTNLFNGNKQLGDSTNKFLNENWKEAFDTYRELPEKAFSEFLKSMSNRVYSLYPKEELFPL